MQKRVMQERVTADGCHQGVPWPSYLPGRSFPLLNPLQVCNLIPLSFHANARLNQTFLVLNSIEQFHFDFFDRRRYKTNKGTFTGSGVSKFTSSLAS